MAIETKASKDDDTLNASTGTISVHTELGKEFDTFTPKPEADVQSLEQQWLGEIPVNATSKAQENGRTANRHVYRPMGLSLAEQGVIEAQKQRIGEERKKAYQ
jgi:hypothetical protein